MKSVSGLATFVLIVGAPAACFLTFGVSVSFLFSFFTLPSLLSELLGYSSLAGPVPLVAGAVLLFSHRTQMVGARLVLVGSVILSLYMVICLTQLDVDSVRISEQVLWFILIPLAVVAVDYAAYRIFKLVRASAPQAQE
jgi:hypothetical protein